MKDPSSLLTTRSFKRSTPSGAGLGVSKAYLDDCRQYILLFNQKFRCQGRALSTWPNVYMKVLRAFKISYPEINLKSISREDIINQGLPCRAIAAAVEAEYREKVPNSDDNWR